MLIHKRQKTGIKRWLLIYTIYLFIYSNCLSICLLMSSEIFNSLSPPPSFIYGQDVEICHVCVVVKVIHPVPHWCHRYLNRTKLLFLNQRQNILYIYLKALIWTFLKLQNNLCEFITPVHKVILYSKTGFLF